MNRELLTLSAKEIQPHLAEIRKEFHLHPEVSNAEKETSARVVAELEAIGGYEIRSRISGYGVLAEIKGALPGPTIALRADMDALSITEESGLEFASVNEGVMHACGHDTHITCLLGAAALLKKHQDQLKGTVRLIFQPAEEKSPIGGSRRMIDAGALDGADAVYGLHVWPGLPFGKVGVKAGPQMAASDHYFINLKGISSHGAMPHKGVDAVVAGAQIVTALQSIVGRNVDPLKSAVITIGRFHAGTRYNIVAEECQLEGTCRTFDPEIRDLCEKRIKAIAQGIGEGMGCQVEIIYERGYMPVINHAASAAYMQQIANDLFGEGTAVTIEEPSMCSEDFAFYIEKTEGAFAWLGTDEEGKTSWPLHNCHFAPNEEILWRGAAFLAQLAMEYK